MTQTNLERGSWGPGTPWAGLGVGSEKLRIT